MKRVKISFGAETTAVTPTVAFFQAAMTFPGWSMMRANGARIIVDMIERTPKKFAGPIFSPFGLFIESFEKMFLAVKAKLEDMADRNPSHVNETSDTEAVMTPATTGTRERYTGIGKMDFKKMAEPTTLTNGSMLLTTWVKDTATAPREMTVPTWPTI